MSFLSDLEYVVDLGLIRRGPSGPVVSNGLYRKVIPRQLTSIAQANLEALVPPSWYLRSDGSLDMEKLLHGFQQFFRENSEHWSQRFDYQEAWPQLLMQAYLQRVVNRGGQVHREYGLGRGRTDLLVVWREQRFILELKVVRQSPEQTLDRGLEQIASYMDRQQMSEGHLILFDRTAGKAWEEKIIRREEKRAGKLITVWGM
ncbi:MAG: PD-(D/E)XK nuclease domain-containing protein [Chloroflexi bacterium]|nr:PD-(D/E)XK nuclease domain-containing protein [Chloroflexota bacterium]